MRRRILRARSRSKRRPRARSHAQAHPAGAFPQSPADTSLWAVSLPCQRADRQRDNIGHMEAAGRRHGAWALALAAALLLSVVIRGRRQHAQERLARPPNAHEQAEEGAAAAPGRSQPRGGRAARSGVGHPRRGGRAAAAAALHAVAQAAAAGARRRAKRPHFPDSKLKDAFKPRWPGAGALSTFDETYQ
ncbi:MAG: hypothetical protein J3K34DRAFT_414206 [Monoraphidium minutum]|nr:MAG: hypothetical protein J3K34DRAFT_414206 [Monoraphidium minutum]